MVEFCWIIRILKVLMTRIEFGFSTPKMFDIFWHSMMCFSCNLKQLNNHGTNRPRTKCSEVVSSESTGLSSYLLYPWKIVIQITYLLSTSLPLFLLLFLTVLDKICIWCNFLYCDYGGISLLSLVFCIWSLQLYF